MTNGQREKKIVATRINVDGNPAIIGALRRQETTPLIEAPFVVKTFNEEYGTEVKLIRPQIVDHLLLKTKRWKELDESFPSPISMLIAYEKPGKTFESEIVYTEKDNSLGVILPTGQYKGEKGIALIVTGITADDFKKDGKDLRIVVPDDRLVIVPEFPDELGWYMPHTETRVPCGKKVEESMEARHLWRRIDSSYVGLVIRDDGYGDVRDFATGLPQHDLFGIAVEVSERDAELVVRRGDLLRFQILGIGSSNEPERPGEDSHDSVLERLSIREENGRMIAGLRISQELFGEVSREGRVLLFKMASGGKILPEELFNEFSDETKKLLLGRSDEDVGPLSYHDLDFDSSMFENLSIRPGYDEFVVEGSIEQITALARLLEGLRIS